MDIDAIGKERNLGPYGMYEAKQCAETAYDILVDLAKDYETDIIDTMGEMGDAELKHKKGVLILLRSFATKLEDHEAFYRLEDF